MTAPRCEYLVQYGRPAFVGRFTSADVRLSRGDWVVIRSPRGVEYGTVLCEADSKYAAGFGLETECELVRRTGADDLARVEHNLVVARDILAAADRLFTADGLPVALLDAEVFLDAGDAVLHVVSWAETDLTPFLDKLSRDLGISVRLHDVSAFPVVSDPPASNGCGKPGCGSESGGCSSGGGGCSTGGCSRGAVKSSTELTAYFADLRQKMDAQFGSLRTPLN